MMRPAVIASATAIGLFGCGGAGDPKPPPHQASHSDRLTHRLVVAALGDSITAGTPQWDPDPAVRAPLGDSMSPGSQYEYWAARRLGQKARVRNCGVFGERTDQIARRLSVCARGADVVIIQGGINDIVQHRDPADAAANLRALVRSAKRSGLRVVLANVLPWNNGYPYTAPLIARLNAAIARIGSDEHVPVADFYSALDDPARPGRMRSELTAEGDHPSIPGYRVLGELLARLLADAH